jgi:hypothetical protein
MLAGAFAGFRQIIRNLYLLRPRVFSSSRLHVSIRARRRGAWCRARSSVQEYQARHAALNVRFGSLADISQRFSDVRFTPQSGRVQRGIDLSLVPQADVTAGSL